MDRSINSFSEHLLKLPSEKMCTPCASQVYAIDRQFKQYAGLNDLLQDENRFYPQLQQQCGREFGHLGQHRYFHGIKDGMRGAFPSHHTQYPQGQVSPQVSPNREHDFGNDWLHRFRNSSESMHSMTQVSLVVLVSMVTLFLA
jgi:hypothetical protein